MVCIGVICNHIFTHNRWFVALPARRRRRRRPVEEEGSEVVAREVFREKIVNGTVVWNWF